MTTSTAHAKRFNEIRKRFDNSPLREKNYANIIHKLAEYYDNARDLYDIAFQYEISRIVSALSDRFAFIGKLEKPKENVFIERRPTTELYINYSQTLCLSRPLKNVAKRLIVSRYADKKTNYFNLDEVKESVDIIEFLLSARDKERELIAKDAPDMAQLLSDALNVCCLIVEGTDNFVVKYVIGFNVKLLYRKAINRDRHSGDNIDPAYPLIAYGFEIEVSDCNPIALTQYDIEHINNLNEQERLAKEQEEKERIAQEERKRQREIVIAKQNALFRSLGLKTDENGKIV
ncbi:MAG: hypothetical protein LBO72_05190 [Helicobacteraceae bacterium]|jgi:hypothetical protein|nr:hypothetical protein [Helicobacteraceae bacterium]